MKECPVELYQNMGEFSELLKLYEEAKPRNVLEIGSMYGGTLWYWIQKATAETKIISVDVTVGPWDARHEDVLKAKKLWPGWAKEKGVELVAIDGSSQDWNVMRRVLNEFAGPIDFAFIDGDHNYEAVIQDYKTVRMLMGRRGIIAFHDVDLVGWPVRQAWRDMKKEIAPEKLREIIEKPGDKGIGVVFL